METIYDLVTQNQGVAIFFLIVVGLLVLWAVLYFRPRTAEEVVHEVWYRRLPLAPAREVQTTQTVTQTPAPGPTIGITPRVGPERGNQQVTLTGTGFHKDAKLELGGNRAIDVRVNRDGTRLTARTPAHSLGTVDVTIANPDGQSASLPNGYEFN